MPRQVLDEWNDLLPKGIRRPAFTAAELRRFAGNEPPQSVVTHCLLRMSPTVDHHLKAHGQRLCGERSPPAPPIAVRGEGVCVSKIAHDTSCMNEDGREGEGPWLTTPKSLRRFSLERQAHCTPAFEGVG